MLVQFEYFSHWFCQIVFSEFGYGFNHVPPLYLNTSIKNKGCQINRLGV